MVTINIIGCMVMCCAPVDELEDEEEALVVLEGSTMCVYKKITLLKTISATAINIISFMLKTIYIKGMII